MTQTGRRRPTSNAIRGHRRILVVATLLLASVRLAGPGFCLMNPPSSSPAAHACCSTGLRALDAGCCTVLHPVLASLHVPVIGGIEASGPACLFDSRKPAALPLDRAADRTHSPPLSTVLRV